MQPLLTILCGPLHIRLGLCTCKSGVQPAQKPCTERTWKNNSLTSLSLFFPCSYRFLPLGERDSQPEAKGDCGCSQHRSDTKAKLRGEGKTICGGASRQWPGKLPVLAAGFSTSSLHPSWTHLSITFLIPHQPSAPFPCCC